MNNTQRNVFDLAQLDVVAGSENGIEIEIFSPTGAATGIVFKVLGGFSERFQERLTRAVRAAETREKNPVARAVGKDGDEFAELLGSVSIDWGHKAEDEAGKRIVGEDGKELVNWGEIQLRGEMLPFSKAKATEIYRGFPIIRKQVLDAALNAVNFVKG